MTNSAFSEPPATPPLATLRLHMQGSRLFQTLTPSVYVNGAMQRVAFGPNDIVIYAGPTHVHCEAQWLRTYGQADLTFEATPGSLTEVWYAPPVSQLSRGNIGHEPQRTGGVGVLVGAFVGTLLLIALVVVLVSLG